MKIFNNKMVNYFGLFTILMAIFEIMAAIAAMKLLTAADDIYNLLGVAVIACFFMGIYIWIQYFIKFSKTQ
jgi:hypothetical protein